MCVSRHRVLPTDTVLSVPWVDINHVCLQTQSPANWHCLECPMGWHPSCVSPDTESFCQLTLSWVSHGLTSIMCVPRHRVLLPTDTVLSVPWIDIHPVCLQTQSPSANWHCLECPMGWHQSCVSPDTESCQLTLSWVSHGLTSILCVPRHRVLLPTDYLLLVFILIMFMLHALTGTCLMFFYFFTEVS